MKKFVSVIMAMILVLGCFAACGSKNDTPATTEPVKNGPGSSLEVLETIWGLHGDEEKFSVYGGNPKENFEENTLDKPDV